MRSFLFVSLTSAENPSSRLLPYITVITVWAVRDHVLSRLERVWGPGDGRPVEDLKVAIDQVNACSM